MASSIPGSWGWPLLSRKAHFFQDMRSLCGGWLYGGAEQGDADATASFDDCKACTRKLEQLKAKA